MPYSNIYKLLRQNCRPSAIPPVALQVSHVMTPLPEKSFRAASPSAASAVETTIETACTSLWFALSMFDGFAFAVDWPGGAWPDLTAR